MNTQKKEVSKVGLGCVTFGREIDVEASFRMMDHALENGVTMFDTAAAYSDGESERIIGKWLADKGSAADPVLVCTKVLPPYTTEKVRSSFESSLKRIGRDYIDVFYFHSWDDSSLNPAVLAVFNDLLIEGKIKKIGASNFSFEQLSQVVALQHALGFQPVGMIQNNHNLAVSDLSEELLQFCAVENIDVITYSPLGAGFLTGKHQNGVASGSRFDIIPGHQQVYFNSNAQLRLAQLQKVALSTGESAVHLALAWALHQPGVTSVLVGGRTPDYLDQAFAAESFDDPGVFAELERSVY